MTHKQELYRANFILDRTGEWLDFAANSGIDPDNEDARILWESGYSIGYVKGITFRRKMWHVAMYISIAAILIYIILIAA
jgi:hypothetical protein